MGYKETRLSPGFGVRSKMSGGAVAEGSMGLNGQLGSLRRVWVPRKVEDIQSHRTRYAHLRGSLHREGS